MASPFRPKRPAWFVASAVMMVLALAIYAGWAWWSPWRPGRVGGLVFGTVAAVVFLLDGLYPLRRRLLAWPLRTAQQWLQFHIYGGLVAGLCVAIHMGFAWPKGMMGWWLLVLTAWTIATGVFGVLLQKWIPSVIAGTLHIEALAVRVPELTARLLAEADEVMREASDRLCVVYQTDIRPVLERPQPAWMYVANVQAGRLRFSGPLDSLDRAVTDPDRLGQLRAIVTEKAELDIHLSLQRALRAWLVLHVPPAIVLLGVLAVHIFAVLYL